MRIIIIKLAFIIGSCKIAPMFKKIINKCRTDYNWIDDDAKSYNVSWEPLSNLTSKNDKCKTPWCYQVI